MRLFQFLDSTWPQVMKQERSRLADQANADAIVLDGDGDFTIKDKSLRVKVQKLREDPAADLSGI